MYKFFSLCDLGAQEVSSENAHQPLVSYIVPPTPSHHCID